MTHDIALARAAAEHYRFRGYNVLPSDPSLGHPPYPYKRWWDEPAPAELFDRYPLPSLQVVCGRRWGLLVIDLDGDAARERWATLGRTPKTWETHSGGGGTHLWFTIPTSGPPLPKGFLWKGQDKHTAIERLCDRSLVMAPPSLHKTTGRRYRYASKWLSPLGLPKPAPCPGWILDLEVIRPPSPMGVGVAPIQRPPVMRPAKRPRVAGPLPAREEVLDSIPDKIALARRWGVRFRGRPRGDWHPCHAFDREDVTPSAAVNSSAGVYVDLGTGRKLSFFDLAIALGVYSDYAEAVANLGGSHGR